MKKLPGKFQCHMILQKS